VSFFRRSFSPVPALEIKGERVLLRTPEMNDFEPWAALRGGSRAFLTPWEPLWAADELDRAAYRQRMRRFYKDMDRDEAYPFFIFRAEDKMLLGGLTLGNVRRGAARMASLGYWMGENHAGQGYMSTAVRLATQFAFDRLDLRRIEAACLPENMPSIRLLEATGFRREGYAREYLNIAGIWRDHLLFALLKSDPVAKPRA
jgi:[ribosomal protein S5]-alanine N-acetyltransferase